MPVWSQEEIAQLVDAVVEEDSTTITKLMNLYQQRTPVKLLKDLPHYYIAAYEGIFPLYEHYLKKQRIDDEALFNSLDMAIFMERIAFLQGFFASKHVNFDPNYRLSLDKKVLIGQQARGKEYNNTEVTLLCDAEGLASQDKKYLPIFEFILNIPQIKINQILRKGYFSTTRIFYAIYSDTDPKLIKLLLDHGADPLQEVMASRDSHKQVFNVFTFLDFNDQHHFQPISHTAEYRKILKEWQINKSKIERESDEGCSSGERSPASTGSAEGSPKNRSPEHSPPKHSVMPPDSPVASRNGSPPGSPMLKSDSSSSGSAGSSPEKITSDARDHELRDMLAESDMSNAKSLYDTGKITFKCTCFECSSSDENVLQDILCLKGEKFVNLARYILDHTKYPADINIRNKNKKTCLHLLAARKFDIKNKPLDELKHLFLSYGGKYSIDVNAKDKDGNTPLHLASANGNADLVAELLKHNADYSIKNNEGLEPYEYAARECKDSQKKGAVLAAMPRGSIVVSTPLAARSTSASTPIAIHNASGASPSVTTSYVASRAGVFSGRQDSYSLPDSTPVLRTQPAQIGAMYVPPPLTHDQLPRPIKKPGQIIMPQAVITNATTHADNKKSNSSVVTNKIKSLLGK